MKNIERKCPNCGAVLSRKYGVWHCDYCDGEFEDEEEKKISFVYGCGYACELREDKQSVDMAYGDLSDCEHLGDLPEPLFSAFAHKMLDNGNLSIEYDVYNMCYVFRGRIK